MSLSPESLIDIIAELEDLDERMRRLETLEFPENNLLVQNQGATLPGEFFTEMNFEGAGVAASIDPGNALKALITMIGGGGAKGPTTGCTAFRSYILGTSTYWQISHGGTTYDPDDMWSIFDPTAIYIPSTGYWLGMCTVRFTNSADLTGDVDKIATVNGDILVYDGVAIDDEWDFEGGAVFCLTAGPPAGYNYLVDLIMYGIYRCTDISNNPYFTGEILVRRDPAAGWNNLPFFRLYERFYVVKIGNLET